MNIRDRRAINWMRGELRRRRRAPAKCGFADETPRLSRRVKLRNKTARLAKSLGKSGADQTFAFFSNLPVRRF